ncbi:RNA 2',3'-cyclic phosphodiesterase [Micrococcus terreus]|uniref:RNA 2',3'-cyclic phosphodiesterase n=1 Tax=Micrococcus terreus TaxID=574650 RepID=UPI00254CD25A|nr:RNA 2',3'-cyclic phosphodiesterase [Micrococcus terreus]MDK7700439.1 RNA 2',3'-cyclic phosphodiesterase [Micrococcus terreus]WOO98761.1 RNA 2',3'-cyclic phosphodiesterase [Micrococcus terreus]
MGTRMFAAVYPPEDVREELAEFLEARPGMRWTPPEQMHLTLAFMEAVPDRSVEPLADLLAEACAGTESFLCGLHGAGAFPHPDRPAVLWLGVEDGAEQLRGLARRVRNAANRAGATPDGQAFTPHLTLARPGRGTNATRWIRVLETFSSRLWEVPEVHLVESVLQGHGHRPRHQSVAVLLLGTAHS